MPRKGSSAAGDGIGAWLRTLSEADLTALLERRTDLLHRPPTSLDDLGNRLSTPQSTSSALQLLDRTAVQVGALLSTLGGRATVPQLVEALCRTAPVEDAAVAAALDRLARVGLAWPVGGGAWRSAAGLSHDADGLLGLAPPLRRLAAGMPLTQLRSVLQLLDLGGARSSHDAVEAVAALFEDEKRLRAVLDEAPPDAVELLEHVAGAGHGSLLDGSAGERWLAERMLLLVQPQRTRLLAREVALLVRGERLVGVVRLEPEARRGAAPSPGHAAGEALRLVDHVRALLAACESEPPKVLQSGGIGVQAQRRLGKTLDLQTEYVAWLLDLAGEARLLGTMGSAGRLTSEAGEWRVLDEPAAYVALVRAVLDSPAGPRPAIGDPPAPLAGWRYAEPSLLPLPLVLAGAARHSGQEDSDALIDWLDWLHYRPLPAGQRRIALECRLHQLMLLALRDHDACPPWAAALRRGDDELAIQELAAALPPSQDEAVFQADGTVFVGARPSVALRALLGAVGTQEAERTWRVSPASVRHVLDEGRSVEDLLVELRERSKHALPQVVEQLVRDVAAKHGRIQVFDVKTLLRVDDVPLAVEVLRDKRLKALALVEVQPGILSSPKPVKDVLAALRSAGHAPVADGAATAPRPKPVTVHRGAPRPASGPSAADLAARLVRAPAGSPAPSSMLPLAEDDLLARISHLTIAEQDLLGGALLSGERVEIDYTDTRGRFTTRVVSDLGEDGHLLVGWCELRDDERMFSPEGILAVRSAR